MEKNCKTETMPHWNEIKKSKKKEIVKQTKEKVISNSGTRN